MTLIAKLISALFFFSVVVWAEDAVASPEDMEVISSREIMDMVGKDQSINYNHVIIVGDIDLKEMDMNNFNEITIPIEIQDSIIYGNIILDSIVLREPVNFERTKLFGMATFNETKFLESANFQDVQFDRDAFFLGSQFNDSANFWAARFNRSANFLNAKFRGKLAEFERTRFNGSANFATAQFDVDTTSFSEARFLENAIFWEAGFNCLTDFRGTLFDDNVDFRFGKFAKPSDFTGAKFGRNVNLNGIEFESLIIDWFSLKGRAICNGPVYIDLVKNFRDLERFDDADDCYYHYREWKRNSKPFGWSKVFDYLAWISCGYGVRWYYPILSGFLIIILFGIYYDFYALSSIMLNVIKVKGSEGSKDSWKIELKHNLKRSIFFSAITLLSLPSDWFPYRKEVYREYIKYHLYCATLERLIGWGLMLLLISTITRIMVRY